MRYDEKQQMEALFYTVKRIDGDYAYLIIPERQELEEKCVARALLPESITEGSALKYEMFQYELME